MRNVSRFFIANLTALLVSHVFPNFMLLFCIKLHKSEWHSTGLEEKRGVRVGEFPRASKYQIVEEEEDEKTSVSQNWPFILAMNPLSPEKDPDLLRMASNVWDCWPWD